MQRLSCFVWLRIILAPVRQCSMPSIYKNPVSRLHNGKPETEFTSLIKKAVRTGLEPVTSCVTGRHSNQAELTHLVVSVSIAVAKVRTFF